MTDDLHELLELYVLDALDDDERAAVDARLDRDDTLQAELASLQAAAADLGRLAAAAPPPAMRDAVLDTIATTPQTPAARPDPATATPVVDELAVRRSARHRRWAAVAAAAAAVVIGALLVSGADDLSPAEDLRASDDAIVTALQGDQGTVEVIWSPALDEVAVVTAGLADVDADQTFELWFVLDDGSVARAGLFRTENGSVEKRWSVDDRVAAGWGVTVEPAGGSDTPTSEVIYLGTIADGG